MDTLREMIWGRVRHTSLLVRLWTKLWALTIYLYYRISRLAQVWPSLFSWYMIAFVVFILVIYFTPNDDSPALGETNPDHDERRRDRRRKNGVGRLRSRPSRS